MDRDFRNALNNAIAEITPQPWDWTDPNGATLTVIPAGLRAEPGDAEVTIRITAGKTLAAEIGVTTTDLPDLIDALTKNTNWEHQAPLGMVSAIADGVVVLLITAYDWDTDERRESMTAIRLPDRQRLPLAAALQRALDVARGWED